MVDVDDDEPLIAVTDLPGGFSVTASGRVMSRRGNWLKPTTEKRGTLRVWYGSNDYHYVAVLVCTAFHGSRPSSRHVVRHWDDDPKNNAASNLSWGTYAENYYDRIRNGGGNEGERCGKAKLTWEKVRDIRSSYSAGGITYHQLAEKYGVHDTCIQKIINKERWKE